METINASGLQGSVPGRTPRTARDWAFDRRAPEAGTTGDDSSKGILAEYARSAESGDWEWKYRCLVSGLSRELHACSTKELTRETEAEPPKIERKWDALIAAVTAFACSNRGIPTPEWTRKPERQLDSAWCCWDEFVNDDEYTWLPAAFLQHGALCGPSECDDRNSPFAEWVPDR